MSVGKRGYLSRMRNAEYLRAARRLLQLYADLAGGLAGYTRIDLIVDERGNSVKSRKHAFKRQHDTRKLAARRYFGKRALRLAGVRCYQKFNTVKTVRRRLVRRLDGNMEPHLRHIKESQRIRHAGLYPGGGGTPKLSERRAGLIKLARKLGLASSQCGYPIVSRFKRRKPCLRVFTEGDDFLDRRAVLALQP